jgi:hypothetical protein
MILFAEFGPYLVVYSIHFLFYLKAMLLDSLSVQVRWNIQRLAITKHDSGKEHRQYGQIPTFKGYIAVCGPNHGKYGSASFGGQKN